MNRISEDEENYNKLNDWYISLYEQAYPITKENIEIYESTSTEVEEDEQESKTKEGWLD